MSKAKDFFLNAIVIITAIIAIMAVVYVINTLQPPEEITMSAVYVDDFSDDRKVAGFSKNIFFGTVKSIHKTDEADYMTYYVVDVSDNLKGHVDKQIIVRQDGITTQINGKTYIYKMSGDQLLEVGQEYLLATRPGPKKAFYHVAGIPNQGHTKITNLADKTLQKERFEKAIKNEHKYPAQMMYTGDD